MTYNKYWIEVADECILRQLLTVVDNKTMEHWIKINLIKDLAEELQRRLTYHKSGCSHFRYESCDVCDPDNIYEEKEFLCPSCQKTTKIRLNMFDDLCPNCRWERIKFQ